MRATAPRISCRRSTATSPTPGATISTATTGCGSSSTRCTRMRFCTPDGTDGVPRKARRSVRARGLRAVVRARRPADRGERRIVCGHWSTLELMLAPNVLMLDSGCLWGGALTAVRLPDRRVYQVPVAHAGGRQSRSNSASPRLATARAGADPAPAGPGAGSGRRRCARSPQMRQNDAKNVVSPA